jgi:hypothetical protein
MKIILIAICFGCCCGCARKEIHTRQKRQIGFEISGKVIEPDLLDRSEFASKGGSVYSFYLKNGIRVKDGEEIIYNSIYESADVTIKTYVDGTFIEGKTVFDTPP